MIKSKKQMYIVVGAFLVVLMLFTTTYAFFNYTRTGTANIIRTGQINFNSEQGTAINLTNLFPIDVSEGIPNDATKVGTVTINITGDTTYGEGIEYLVSAVNVSNTVGSKSLPISIDVSVASNTENTPATTLGTASNDYYNDRGSTTSYYSVLADDVIENNDKLVVGYIAPGQTGVDGNIVIRAYLDASKIAISDTYPSGTVRNVITTGYSSSDCETVLDGVTNASTYCATAADLQDAIDGGDLTSAQIALLVTGGIVEEYTDGTTSTWVGDRTVFTTAEWNSLQTNGVSFQVKVEANEGTWIEAPIPTIDSCPGCKFMYARYTGDYNYGENGSTLADIANNGDVLVDDYTTLIDYSREIPSNTFLGFVIENDVIVKAYACGIKREDPNNGVAFCVEGSKNGSTWSANQSFLNDPTTGLWQGGCISSTGDTPYIRCEGEIVAIANANGYVAVNDDNSYEGGSCYVRDNSWGGNFGGKAACFYN